jgi:hypothetical protein
MLKLRIFRFLIFTVLCVSLLANLAFPLGVCSAFFRGGMEGVGRWINHITCEGRGQIVEVSPGVVQIKVALVKHVYLSFVLDWLLIIASSVLSFLRVPVLHTTHSQQGSAT